MALIALLFYLPVIVFAWLISPIAGLTAIALIVFAAFIGSDTWGGSGPYRRR